MTRKSLLFALIFLTNSPALAEWKVENGRKAFSSFAPATGAIVTSPAKAPYRGVTARLQIECFTHPELTGLSFGIVLSKEPPNGFMAWQYQYDENAAVKRGPYSRALPATSISLGDGESGELKGLRKAQRLRLTLLPADGSQMPFEFDVAGADAAIKTIPCKGNRQ